MWLFPEAPQSFSGGAERQLRVRREVDKSPDDQSKRLCVDELSLGSWSGPAGGKHSLNVDGRGHRKKQHVEERNLLHLSVPPLPPDYVDEILWSMLVKNDGKISEEWKMKTRVLKE